jgi:putative N6-adenine-specific DNA methylase
VEAFAVTAPGLEPIVAAELKGLRVTRPRVVDGGVEFRAGRELLYTTNLHLRAASRVLVRLATFHAASFAELERRARHVPWEFVVPDRGRVRLRVTCRKSRLYHSDGVSERLMTAIAGRTNALPAEKTPSDRSLPDDEHAAAQLFVVRVERDECTISADASGAHLHRRGYRQAVTQAPLRETLAAAIVLGSRWDQRGTLLDPFCGSGTIPIEAALLARRIAPGRGRRFQFMDWPDFDASIWDRVVARAVEAELPQPPGAIVGSDRSGWAMRAADGNAKRAGVADDVVFERTDVSELSPPPGGPGWIVTNPPYGVRLGARDELRRLYAEFGAVLRERFARWSVSILSTDRRLDAQLRIALLDRFRTTNGGIRVHFLSGRVGAR